MLVSWTTLSSLASQTQFHKGREGSGELRIQAVSRRKPCPAALYGAVQSRCSIFHMTHYITVSVAIAVLKKSQDIFSATAGAVKTFRLYFSGRVLTPQQVHYLKSGYVIQLIAFRWGKACILSSLDPSLFCGNGSGL